MKLLALVFAVFLASCSLGPPAPPASEDMREVKFWHDVARGVGCWIWYGSGRGGISCLPDSQYTSPTTQNAPHAVSYGVGRPGTPGMASVSTSAPRSGLNVISVPATSSPGERNLSGSIGAPTSVAWPGAAFVQSGWITENRPIGAPLFARTGIGTAAGSLKGVSSYYGTGPAGVAAAGPNLRAALGRNWRGTWVRVSYRGRSAWLRLGDACWCQVADIDIPTRTFSYLSRGELWRGLLRVTITWGDAPRLPATDMVAQP